MDAREFLEEQPKVYRLSWVERLLEEYAKQKCIEQKEIDISIAKKTGLVSAIRNQPLATDK